MSATRSDGETGIAPPTLAQRVDPAPATTSTPPPDAAAHAENLARTGHALKAPLAVIKGSATTLLASQWDAATQQELLALIDAQADVLLRLLDSLLDTWRLGAGHTALRLAPQQIAPLLDDLVARWATAQPPCAMRVSAPGDLPLVALDAAWIAQALDRLVGFAAARQLDAAALTIAAHAGDGVVALDVTVPGVPLPAESLPRLFEPLGTAGESGAETDLALVRAVARAHGGAVAAEASLDGHGVLFRLTLPLDAPRGTPHPEAAPAAIAGTARRDQRDQRARPLVVVAERDAHLARLMRATLEERGYRALLADDPRRLARLLDQEDPDLVLLDARLDARLSDAAGGAVAPVLREHGSVPVIVLGAGAEAECVLALDHGAHDYLGRPFGLGELLARVRAALRASAREHQSAPESAFRSGDLTIDFAQRLVRMGERAVPLSRTEFKLLRELARHAGRVLTHEQLLEHVWGPGYGQEVEFLWVYVRRLRRKIEPDPHHPCYILTVPGVGYRLAQL